MSTTMEDAKTHSITAGIHAYIQPDGGWFINNCGFIVGKKNVVVIDTAATEARTLALRQSIEATTSLPITTVINTHWHTDHTNGNYIFPEATIVAHDLAREMMLVHAPTRPDPDGPFPDVEWGDLQPAPPTLTFADSLTLWVDDLRVELRWVGEAAHTTGDVIVWIPEHRILFTGDLAFNGSAPLSSAGSISGTISVLKKLLAMDPLAVVPGHGEICGSEVFTTQLDYLEFVQSISKSAKARGLSPLEAARENQQSKFAELGDAERLVANIHRAYAELDGAVPGAAIDLVATRHDMVALNGGKALTCHA